MKKTIYLSHLSLKEKLGQLLIVKPKGLSPKYIEELKVGGVFFDNFSSKEKYEKAINFYKAHSKIPLFVATDMEGSWNPFRKFYHSPTFGEVKDDQEAYDLGIEHGKLLREMGFNLNFSPVVELENNVWPGRNFEGDLKEVGEKISAYIQGLHKAGVFATAKHYPGGNLVKNPHLKKVRAKISKEDLELFNLAISEDVDAIMVGHTIVSGELNSHGKQSSRSREVLEPLRRRFKGLIITDAVTMLGLRLSYPFDFNKVYPDLIRAGNDIILDTSRGSGFNAVKRRLRELEKQVKEGKLSEKVVDDRVKRILEKKGYLVLD
ncbi:hypothetical protein B6U91_02095 [Candidatus Pacearchaeota archaeon ex4484_71]|nr:MAG: hypothetical protein B6U91_02095 [Candidatus Pacearchaeota archaeon ex4484_71]